MKARAFWPLFALCAASAAQADTVKPVLMLRGLDKITGRAFDIAAPLNVPVKFATLTIVARYCYSTPQSETPETSAFVQIDDVRPDKPAKRVFSATNLQPGWSALHALCTAAWTMRSRRR